MIDGSALSPGLILILSGLATLALENRTARAVVMLAAPLLTLAYVVALWRMAAPAPEGSAFAGEPVYATTMAWLGMELVPVRVDALSGVFGTVFSIVAFCGALFVLERENRRELACLQVYAGSAIAAVLAGDLVTLFVFWELMAIVSTLIIFAGGPGAKGPGLRYAVIHFLGGVLLMAGAAGTVAATGDPAFTALPQEGVIPALVLLAFLVNAGAWPLNAWVADAYPRASWAGTVFISAFTTKTAIYALIRGFPGEEWLLWIGLATIAYGVIYALVESEIRRLLCYAIVAQGGFMMVGVGLGTDLGIAGAAGHAAISLLYSLVLFMAAGAVLRATGTAGGEALGGLWRHMPLTAALAVVAGISIAALPLTGAYVSKSLISSGAGYAGQEWVWLGLTAAGVGVVLHGAIRFQWIAFGGTRRAEAPQPGPLRDPSRPMQVAMAIPAALVILVGLLPGPFYAMLPGQIDYTPYKADLVLAQVQLLVFGAVAGVLLMRLLPAKAMRTLDTDWLYRGLGAAVVPAIGDAWTAAYQRLVARGLGAASRFVQGLYRTHGPEGALARTRPTGFVALWMTVLLFLLVVFAFV